MTGWGSAAQFYEQVRAVAARYPDPRSAVLDALRMAQERHGGWLPREAFEEVADALAVTPAYCRSVASFYDMFHLRPVGRHSIEVCTNLACALVGAQAVVDAFEAALGVPPGNTTPDGAVTFNTVECLGGCGYGPVVAVDRRYREPVTPETAAEIVQELRGQS